jgi:hypothetical protein
MRRHKAVTVFCLAALVFLNAWITARLFLTEYTPWMFSIEGAYVGLARWIQDNWRRLDWFPLWYGGIPFENAYPPLLHVIVAAVSQLAGFSPARAHHIVTGALYCLAPAALFWLVLRLSGSRWIAFISGCLFSLVSFSGFLMPSIASDLGSIWASRRIQDLIGYGEGPHVSSLTLLLVALAATHAALKTKTGWRLVAAAVAVASVPLTNWLGAFALACGVLAMSLSMHKPEPARILTIGLLAYAFAAPWIKPSTVADIQRNAQLIASYTMGAPQYAYLAIWLLLTIGCGLALRRSRFSEAARFALLWILLMAAPPLGFEWFRAYPIPQPNRYHLEMEIALAIGCGMILGRPRKWLAVPVAAALCALAWYQAPFWKSYANSHVTPFEITQTLEWEAATWLQRHRPGQRVFATGSVQFWLNAFAGNPLLSGGFDQGRHNQTLPAVLFRVPYTSADGERTAAILQAYGVRAVVVDGEKTRNAYRAFKDPGKFNGVLEEIWRSGDDVIYEVPSRSGGLVHVLGANDLMKEPEFESDALGRFVAALNGSSVPSVQWRTPAHASISARIHPGQVIHVQMSHHHGWRAESAGVPCTVRADGLGLTVIQPACTGPCTIDLIYDGGLEAKLARLLFWLGILASGWIVFRGYGTRPAA